MVWWPCTTIAWGEAYHHAEAAGVGIKNEEKMTIEDVTVTKLSRVQVLWIVSPWLEWAL
jgi:hypothetical protein